MTAADVEETKKTDLLDFDNASALSNLKSDGKTDLAESMQSQDEEFQQNEDEDIVDNQDDKVEDSIREADSVEQQEKDVEGEAANDKEEDLSDLFSDGDDDENENETSPSKKIFFLSFEKQNLL